MTDLKEEKVDSSWIDEIKFDPEKENVVFVTKTGRAYEVVDSDKNLFKKWLNSDSHGAFFNKKIRNVYTVKPL